MLDRGPGGSAILCNHDLALVRAARLDDAPASPYGIETYQRRYDHDQTFLGYLGRTPKHGGEEWETELQELRDAIPARHREFFVSLPRVVESPSHLFLHCGLSDELGATATEQVAARHRREWDRTVLKPVPGSDTDVLWEPQYPVWIGVVRNLSRSPLLFP
jgi:serine/threonine protein phosphatase 1